MASRLYIAKVGGGSIELTSFTGRKGIPFFDGDTPLIQLGMRCANGEASQGSFKVTDPIAELPRADFAFNLPAHKLVWWTEDAPGAEIWLSRGRAATYEGGRGTVVLDNIVEYDVTVDDGNIDLRGQAFTVAWERPAETGVARLIALQAYTLNGASSTAVKSRDTCEITVSSSHLCPNTNTVVMPAKTYPIGTQPQDVIGDCADTEGKVYGVVIHHTGGSHLCLLYILETDHTTYLSPISISDNLSDWDPTDLSTPTFEPHWEAGKATIYDGQELLSGLVSIYGTDQSVFVENAGNITSYDYWVDSYYDADSEDTSQATSRADSLLLYRGLTTVTHRVSIIMLPEQLDLVAAGMSLSIKAAAAIGGADLDTWQTRRIAECQFEPRIDGRYWAHLNLDRAQRRSRNSSGPAAPAATTPQVPGPPVVGDVEVCADTCIPVDSGWFGDGLFAGTGETLYDGIEYGELSGDGYAVDQDSTVGSTEGIAFVGAPPSTVDYTFALGTHGGHFYGVVYLPALADTGTLQGFQFHAYNANETTFPPHLELVRNAVAVGLDTTAIRADGGQFGSTSAYYDLGLVASVATVLEFKLHFDGLNVKIKAWPLGDPEPAAYQATTTRGFATAPASINTYFNLAGVADVVQGALTDVRWCAENCADVPESFLYIWTSPTFAGTADGTSIIFSLPSYPPGGVLNVIAYVNGNYEPTAFDAGARTFTFGVAPAAGDLIDVAWIPIP